MYDNEIFAQLLTLLQFSFQHHTGKNVPVLWKSWQTMRHSGYVKLLKIYLYSMPSRVGKRNWWVRQSSSNLNLIVNVAYWKVLYMGAENGRHKLEISWTLLRSSCEPHEVRRSNCEEEKRVRGRFGGNGFLLCRCWLPFHRKHQAVCVTAPSVAPWSRKATRGSLYKTVLGRWQRDCAELGKAELQTGEKHLRSSWCGGDPGF